MNEQLWDLRGGGAARPGQMSQGGNAMYGFQRPVQGQGQPLGRYGGHMDMQAMRDLFAQWRAQNPDPWLRGRPPWEGAEPSPRNRPSQVVPPYTGPRIHGDGNGRGPRPWPDGQPGGNGGPMPRPHMPRPEQQPQPQRPPGPRGPSDHHFRTMYRGRGGE